MAEAMKIHASEIEGLEDVLTGIVRKEFAHRPPMEDMEELKRSPAGTMIRLEGQVQSLTNLTEMEFENIDKQFENIDKQFEKIDERFEKIDERFEMIDERFDKIEADQVRMDKDVQTVMVKIDEQAKRLSIFQKVTYAFLGVIIAMLAILMQKLL